jgi:hypothetical protein
MLSSIFRIESVGFQPESMVVLCCCANGPAVWWRAFNVIFDSARWALCHEWQCGRQVPPFNTRRRVKKAVGACPG